MAGIYGNNIFDRHFENMLDNYLNSYDSEKEELNDFVKDLENQIDEILDKLYKNNYVLFGMSRILQIKKVEHILENHFLTRYRLVNY